MPLSPIHFITIPVFFQIQSVLALHVLGNTYAILSKPNPRPSTQLTPSFLGHRLPLYPVLFSFFYLLFKLYFLDQNVSIASHSVIHRPILYTPMPHALCPKCYPHPHLSPLLFSLILLLSYTLINTFSSINSFSSNTFYATLFCY